MAKKNELGPTSIRGQANRILAERFPGLQATQLQHGILLEPNPPPSRTQREVGTVPQPDTKINPKTEQAPHLDNLGTLILRLQEHPHSVYTSLLEKLIALINLARETDSNFTQTRSAAMTKILTLALKNPDAFIENLNQAINLSDLK